MLCLGFYFLFKDINKNIKTFENIWDTVMQLFQMTLGEFRVSLEPNNAATFLIASQLFKLHSCGVFSTTAVYRSLHMVVFFVQYTDFGQTRLSVLTKAVFLVFALVVPILLLNMLIAMMGNTYQQIISRSVKEQKRQVRVSCVRQSDRFFPFV